MREVLPSQEFSGNSEIKKLVETIRKNKVLAKIIGEQLVTQSFPSAELLACAFQGDTETILSSPRWKQKVQAEIDKTKEEYPDLEEYGITNKDLKKLFEKIWTYSRLTNPKNELVEEVISMIENTEQTAVFASGLAAINATIQQFTQHAREGEHGEYIKGDKIVVIGSIYGGSYAQMMNSFEQTGRQFHHLPISEFLENGLPDDTALVFFEACNNPTLKIIPIHQVVEEAKRVNALTVCDNTFTPLSIRPSDFGIDFTLHSMTKYIGGRSEDLGGSASGKTESISQFSDLHVGERMTKGGIMAPRATERLLKNLEDIPQRLYLATQNAQKIKAIAEKYGLKTRTLETDPNFAQVKNHCVPDTIGNGMVSLYLESLGKARAFVDTMIQKGIGKCAVSLGPTTTLYCIPNETTHSEMQPEEQKKIGITPGLVRISCGVEKDLPEKFEEVLKQ